MISRILLLLQRGWNQVKANTKLVFLTIILFVFPLLFVVVLERFYDVAAANIQTIDMQAIGTFHDSIAAISNTSRPQLASTLEQVTLSNPDIVSARLYRLNSPSEVEIIYALDPTMIGSTGSLPTLLRTSLQEPQQTFSTTVYQNSKRYVQSARLLSTEPDQLYLFTEHDRSGVDFVLTKRKQDAYIVLSVIFAFIIGLAYWISRQSDWEARYRKLEATLQERDLFSNMIAHEFRTPLTAIKGYASFLQEAETLSAEEKRFADTIRDSAERLVLLVNDFLELARIQSGKLKIEKTEIDIRKPIQVVVDSLVATAEAKGLQLIYTSDLHPQILHTDHNRFIQILTNIVSNSIKYTDTGRVEITCDTERSGFVIRVKDTGSGISATDQQKLFAPFARVGNVEDTATTGTGLGMWITKNMIELLEGEITVESIQDVGTHVVMRFKHHKH